MQNFVKYVFVYPEGYADPYRLAEDPDYIPGANGRLEDYHIESVQVVPQIGDTKDFPTIEDKPATWTIVQINPYVGQNTDSTFHELICTQAGDLPQRRDWSDPEGKVLTFDLVSGMLDADEDGFVSYSVGDTTSLWRNQQQCEEFKAQSLVFVPENGRPAQGFDLVLIHKVETAIAATAA